MTETFRDVAHTSHAHTSSRVSEEIERDLDEMMGGPASGKPRTTLDPIAVAVASLTAAGGIVHLLMAPQHLTESTVLGTGFLVAGWLQLLCAVALVLRPSRRWLVATAAVNAASVAAWAWSRNRGLPFVGGAAEPLGFVDVTTALLEMAATSLATATLLTGADRIRRSAQTKTAEAAKWIIPAGALVTVSIMVLSGAVAEHSHGATGHTHSSDTISQGETIAADGHVHSADEAAASTGDDKGFSLLSNGHQHESGVVELDAQTQEELNTQLAHMDRFIADFPTIADAEAAGYRRQGPFAPGLGSHYFRQAGSPYPDSGQSDAWLDNPMLIFDGVQPDSKLAGFMYLGYQAGEPEGFVGPNDHWHFHNNVCLTTRPDGSTDAPFGADTGDVTKELCDSVGGFLLAETPYMLHVWPVRGYESNLGMFSELNPAITCQDGTYYRVDLSESGTRTDLCLDATNQTS